MVFSPLSFMGTRRVINRGSKGDNMQDVTVVVPNYNGIEFVENCLDSLHKQNKANFTVILVDNGSTDGSLELVQNDYPEVEVIALPENTGFCGAVNAGIQKSQTNYVILLNNDTEVEADFVSELEKAIESHPQAFSCAAKMLQFDNRNLIDDAGNFYNAFGWAYARGKGKAETSYNKERKIFSSCAGAAIYRRDILNKIGLFDEEHFAYLEDTDIGYRAQIAGYENWFVPTARVYHMGSATSGSTYNQFKIRYSSRNNIYMIAKNMPIVQLIFNLPLLILGFAVKIVFFVIKGFGREYLAGIKNGFSLARRAKKNGKKVPFKAQNLKNYFGVQVQLWFNIVRRFVS